MNVRIGVPWGNRVPVESNAMPNVVYGVGGGANTAGANVTTIMIPITMRAYTRRTMSPLSGPPRVVAFRTAAMKGGATHPKPAAPYPTPQENSFPQVLWTAFGVQF